MIAKIEINNKTIQVDLSKPLDISAGYRNTTESLRAWYIDQMEAQPVKGDGFIGEVAQGGSVNFFNLTINPHGHGTHTESVGHISSEKEPVDQLLKKYFFLAELRTFETETNTAINLGSIQCKFKGQTEAIIIRTQPNDPQKKIKNYSNTHPPYLSEDGAAWLREQGVEHLLIDLPSVDPEVDGGALKAHRAFWNYPAKTRRNATITELVYIDNSIEDGLYLLELQTAPIENDAVPSRPILYKIENQ